MMEQLRPGGRTLRRGQLYSAERCDAEDRLVSGLRFADAVVDGGPLGMPFRPSRMCRGLSGLVLGDSFDIASRTVGVTLFFSSRRRHTRSVSAFLLNRSSDLLTRRRFLNEWEAFKKVISRRNIRRRITIPLTLSNLKLLRRITRTENILHRNFTRRQVAIQNRVASNIGISQSTFSVKVLNLFSRSRRKTNKRKSKHSAMLRNKETRHRMFIGLLNTTRKLA